MSLREWIDADPEQQQHAQFCPICAAANAARRERVKALVELEVRAAEAYDATTEEGPA